MNSLHSIFIPTTPKDILTFLQNPQKPIQTRKTLIQGEEVLILIHLKTNLKSTSYKWFSETNPIIDLVKTTKMPYATALDDDTLRRKTIEQAITILSSDRYMPLNPTWKTFIESLPHVANTTSSIRSVNSITNMNAVKTNFHNKSINSSQTDLQNDPIFFFLSDESICYLVLKKIMVNEDYLTQPISIRAVLPPLSIDQKYDFYQDTLFTINQIKTNPIEITKNINVIDPLKFTHKTHKSPSSSFMVITLENVSEFEITVGSVRTTCSLVVDKLHIQLPIILKSGDKYTFVIPVLSPIEFYSEMNKKVPNKTLPSIPLSPQQLRSSLSQQNHPSQMNNQIQKGSSPNISNSPQLTQHQNLQVPIKPAPAKPSQPSPSSSNQGNMYTNDFPQKKTSRATYDPKSLAKSPIKFDKITKHQKQKSSSGNPLISNSNVTITNTSATNTSNSNQNNQPNHVIMTNTSATNTLPRNPSPVGGMRTKTPNMVNQNNSRNQSPGVSRLTQTNRNASPNVFGDVAFIDTMHNTPLCSSILCNTKNDITPITPIKTRNTLLVSESKGFSLGLTISYSIQGMLGDLYVSRELAIDQTKYPPITMKISFPERIKCHRVFRVVFELIYQCTTEKHLNLSITSVDNIQSPLYCLHPTIDIGVFSHPCTSSISVEFLANKSGLCTFGPIQLKDTLTGELFKMEDSCKILIEP